MDTVNWYSLIDLKVAILRLSIYSNIVFSPYKAVNVMNNFIDTNTDYHNMIKEVNSGRGDNCPTSNEHKITHYTLTNNYPNRV